MLWLMKRSLLPLALLLPALALGTNRPLVCVGLPPQRWLVRQVAGDRVDVGVLLAPGQNPHTFEPTARQVRELTRADLYLTIGFPFERTVIARVRQIAPRWKSADVAAGVPRRRGEGADAQTRGDEHGDGDAADGADPHVWLAPSNMALVASNTVAALAALDPAGAAAYAAGLERLRGTLGALDADLRRELAPAAGRVLLAYHPSWGYFCDAYGLRQVAIEAEGRPPTARQLAAILDLARQEKVAAVFTEPAYDPRPAEILARQVGARAVRLDPLAEEWDTNLRVVARAILAR